MNWLLMQGGYPPAIIRKEDRTKYISSIEKAQLGGSLTDYQNLIFEAVDRSLDIYLEAASGKQQQQQLEYKSLLKIGQLAKLSDSSVATLRYWTKTGLLPVAKYTPSGYQLYNQSAVTRTKDIRKLQAEQRLTIEEIKQKLT